MRREHDAATAAGSLAEPRVPVCEQQAEAASLDPAVAASLKEFGYDR